MGITATSLKFLLFCKKEFDVDFSITATLGRQDVAKGCGDKTMLDLIKKYVSADSCVIKDVYINAKYCEPLLNQLGAELIESFDYSNYENATVLHDMNMPIPEQFKNKYSLLIDGGTTEHIFNIPIAYKNIMDMVKIGGYVVSMVPANNLCGHGFYQFSPEFFYSLFQIKNGFEIKAIAYSCDDFGGMGNYALWAIPNPLELGRRVLINTSKDTLIYCCTKKISAVPELLTLQQSDYENVSWKKQSHETDFNDSKTVLYIKNLFPCFVKRFIRRLRCAVFARVSKKPEKLKMKVLIK